LVSGPNTSTTTAPIQGREPPRPPAPGPRPPAPGQWPTANGQRPTQGSLSVVTQLHNRQVARVKKLRSVQLGNKPRLGNKLRLGNKPRLGAKPARGRRPRAGSAWRCEEPFEHAANFAQDLLVAEPQCGIRGVQDRVELEGGKVYVQVGDLARVDRLA